MSKFLFCCPNCDYSVVSDAKSRPQCPDCHGFTVKTYPSVTQTKEMPNAPKTPTRTIRVSDELWAAVQKRAKKEGVTVTSVIIDALQKYITKELDKAQ